jgi:hypothetical protein
MAVMEDSSYLYDSPAEVLAMVVNGPYCVCCRQFAFFPRPSVLQPRDLIRAPSKTIEEEPSSRQVTENSHEQRISKTTNYNRSSSHLILDATSTLLTTSFPSLLSILSYKYYWK